MDTSHKDRAARYREIGEEARAYEDSMASERARQDMLDAASVWDQLAELAERMDKPNPGDRSAASSRAKVR